MSHKGRRALQDYEHSSDGKIAEQNWDDLKVFYFVVEYGSFRGAAEKLNKSFNAVRNRVANLERRYKLPLLIRSEKGCTPTEAGQRVFDTAKRMAGAARTLGNDDLEPNEEIAGNVSVRITEGLGSFWLMPKLLSFRQQFPNLILDLQCEMKTPNLAIYEADISVQLTRPTDEAAIVTTLGYLHLMGFVSKEYIREFGEPTWPVKSPHGFVFQIGPQMANDELAKLLDPKALESITVATTNSSTSHYFAVANGAGIGILPSYSRAISRKLIPLTSGPPPLKRPIYLAYNKNMKRTGKIDVVIDWLKEIFDRKKYPWFDEEFIHPDNLEPYLQKDNVIEIFKGADGLIKL